MSEAISGSGVAGFTIDPGCRFAHPGYEEEEKRKEKRRRNAERRVVTIRATADERYRSPRLRARRRPLPTVPRLRGRGGRGRLASRRSIAALAGRLSPCRLSSRPGFLGRGRSVFARRALPAPSCPSPEAAPLTPAVVPERVMPGAARAQGASLRAGTALAPAARLAVRAASLLSENLRIIYRDTRPLSRIVSYIENIVYLLYVILCHLSLKERQTC